MFFNEKNELVRVMVFDGFKSKTEFQNHVVEQMPKSDVLKFDSNSVIAPVSIQEMTAHIVKEGVFIVKYERFIDGTAIADPTVASVQFIENESLPTNDDLFVKNEIPFIFEIDKTSE